jgi:hypothetical protein
MIARRTDSNLPGESSVDLLDDVRKLEIAYSRLRPGAGIRYVEYLDGRIRTYEADRFLTKHLLEHLEYREALASRAHFLQRLSQYLRRGARAAVNEENPRTSSELTAPSAQPIASR